MSNGYRQNRPGKGGKNQAADQPLNLKKFFPIFLSGGEVEGSKELFEEFENMVKKKMEFPHTKLRKMYEVFLRIQERAEGKKDIKADLLLAIAHIKYLARDDNGKPAGQFADGLAELIKSELVDKPASEKKERLDALKEFLEAIVGLHRYYHKNK